MRRAWPLSVLLVSGSLGCGGSTSSPNPPPPPPPPPPAAVATVTLSRDTASLVPQQTVTLTATPRDAAGNALSGRSVSWQSSAAGVATVSTDGLVSAVAPGSADITATSEGRSASARITVVEGALIGPAGGTVIGAGGNAKLTIPAGALSAATPISITPITAPPSPAGLVANTVYELGPSGTTFTQPVTLEIKYQTTDIDTNQARMRLSRYTNGRWVPLPGSSAGNPSRTIRATTSSFSSYGIWGIPVVNEVAVIPAHPTVFFGQTLQLDRRVLDSYGEPLTEPVETSWTSASGAPITSTGLISGAIPGGPYLVNVGVRQWIECEEPCYLGSYDYGKPTQFDVYVDSIYYDRSSTAEVVVALIPVKAITIAPATPSVPAGQKVTLTPTLKDSSGAALSSQYRTIVWASSNAAVASVAQTGEVTALTPGTATISATAEGVSGTTVVTVSVTTSDVSTALVEPGDGEVELGNTVALTTWPQDATGAYLAGRPVVYTSLDPTRATVSSDGIVSGVGLGSVLISALVDGYQSGVSLTVVPAYPLVVGQPGSGNNHACLLRTSGAAWCWGGGEFGQRGDGVKSANQPVPQPVLGGHTFQALSVGGHRACGLDLAGKAHCWGENRYGQLGDGTTIDKATPVEVSGGKTFVKIYAGKIGGLGGLPTFSCGLEAAGTAWCWGYGSFGNGNPTTTHLTPVQVTSVPAFTDLALGSTTACGLTATGETWCFGDQTIPARVASGQVFTALTGGLSHFCGLEADGEVWCWGRNTFGQLGDGSTATRTSPVKVVSPRTFTAIAGQSDGTCALASDQTAWCWGIHGRNGDGTPPRGPTGRQDQATPVAVHGGRHFTALSGGSFTCGRAADGTWCWGAFNFGGELGTINQRFNAPVKIRFP